MRGPSRAPYDLLQAPCIPWRRQVQLSHAQENAVKKNSLKRNRIASAIMSLACTVASAQLAMPVERPELKPGDTWTYRVLDNWTKKETNRYAMWCMRSKRTNAGCFAGRD